VVGEYICGVSCDKVQIIKEKQNKNQKLKKFNWTLFAERNTNRKNLENIGYLS